MFLFRDVMDKQLADRNGDKAGRVDDVLLALRPGERPVVRAIVTGRGAAVPFLPRWLGRIAEWIQEHALGLASVEATTIEWEHVTRIDVVVRVDVDRREDSLTRTEEALWNRWIRRLPWAER